jgi:hypothetical protein
MLKQLLIVFLLISLFSLFGVSVSFAGMRIPGDWRFKTSFNLDWRFQDSGEVTVPAIVKIYLNGEIIDVYKDGKIQTVFKYRQEDSAFGKGFQPF